MIIVHDSYNTCILLNSISTADKEVCHESVLTSSDSDIPQLKPFPRPSAVVDSAPTPVQQDDYVVVHFIPGTHTSRRQKSPVYFVGNIIRVSCKLDGNSGFEI
jgi:hypothetical protein